MAGEFAGPNGGRVTAMMLRAWMDDSPNDEIGDDMLFAAFVGALDPSTPDGGTSWRFPWLAIR